MTQPAASIYRGINVQASDQSDPEQIYVSTRPPQPRPPASLAVHPFNSDVYLSVPLLGSIYKIENGLPRLFAVPNFKEPNQVGLAVDMRGDLYTDNSASDAEFGGRIFSFDRDYGRAHAGRLDELLQLADPVRESGVGAGHDRRVRSLRRAVVHRRCAQSAHHAT